MIDIHLIKTEDRRIAGFDNEPRFAKLLAIVGNDTDKYPILASLDPYGDKTIKSDSVNSLMAELSQAKELTKEPDVVSFINEFLVVCEKVSDKNQIRLEFVGD